MGNKESSTSSKNVRDEQVLTEKDKQNIMTHTSFSNEQIEEWHRGFLRECPNGRMKKRQFESICQQQCSDTKQVKQYTKYAFQTFDKDRNGYINYVEFVLAIAALSNGDMKSNLLLTFKMYDINNDGSISRDELKSIIKALYKLRGIKTFYADDSPSKRVKIIFRKYDKSKDNRINEKEFIDACLNDPMIYSLLIN